MFKWSPRNSQIVHPSISSWEDFWTLLHEIAHAELKHEDFILDIELLGLEADAWSFAAQNLAQRYHTTIPSDFIEDNLDTYRNWVHKRSMCPDCRQNGIQQKTGTYQCLNCKRLWKATEDRQCIR